MDAVRSGASPWMRVDAIYGTKLDAILPKFGLEALSRADRSHLVRVWHRLRPWPDSVAGLMRLGTKFVIAPLSNSDFDCLVAMAKHSALPWDAIFCAELFRHYKPDAEVYRGALALLNLGPHDVMMVAAHNYDLREARSHGMRTAFVGRPTEYGPGQTTDLAAESDWDVITDSFTGLALALGC
jgi:2-haloacid dehalogenase